MLPSLIQSEGLRPSDSPARSLARRFAGALRSRGSLAAARSRLTSAIRHPGPAVVPGAVTYRVLIATAVPILWMSVTSYVRTGAAARDVADGEPVRRPTGVLAPRGTVPDVRLPELRPALPAPEPVLLRNPFAFAPRSLPPLPEPSPVPIAPPLETPPDIPPSAVLSLIGVATTTRADGRAERTAIIAGPADALYMVRESDAVLTRYRVDAVLPDSVRLVDGATGASLNLTLR